MFIALMLMSLRKYTFISDIWLLHLNDCAKCIYSFSFDGESSTVTKLEILSIQHYYPFISYMTKSVFCP